jgi:hypothetical protein
MNRSHRSTHLARAALLASCAALAILSGHRAASGQIFYTTIQNDFYVAHVVNDVSTSPPDSIGGFQLHTGAAHPAGAGQDITYSSDGNVNIGTSFSGIRVNGDNARAYASDAHGGGTANPVKNLDAYFSTQGPTPGYAGAGWRTVWDLFDEQLQITQDVIAVGVEADKAAVYHTVEIVSGRGASTQVEWLNLMDFDTETDGGPAITVERFAGPVLVSNPHEYSHAPSFADELVRVSDFPAAGAYDAFWTLSHDPGLLPVLEGEPLAVTPPNRYQYVAWATAYNPANFAIAANVFDYAVDPTLDVATSIDSAGISLFVFKIPANGTVRFTQAFWAELVPEPATALLASFAAACGLARVRQPR